MGDTNVHIGCSGLPPGMALEEYLEALPFLEVDTLLRSRPTAKTFGKWRRRAPEGSSFALLLPVEPLNLFRGGEEAWEYAVSLVTALEPELVILRSDESVTPTAQGREFLESAFGERLRDTATLAWEAEGIWKPDEVVSLCKSWGALPVLDPLAPDPLEERHDAIAGAAGSIVFRLSGLGLARRNYPTDDLDVVLALARATAPSWIIFNNVGKFKDAQLLIARRDAEDE